MKQLTGGLWGKKEHGESTHSLVSLCAETAMNQSLSPEHVGNDAWAQIVSSTWPVLIYHLSPTTSVCRNIKITLLSQRFFPWNLPWSGIYFTAVVPIWYLYSGIYLIIQLSMCELCEGKGYVLFSLLHFCYKKSQFGHSLLMWQSYNQIVVQWRQKLQWYQKRTSNWLTKRRLFEKSTMPNHKFMGFWTVSQDPGPFQASLELWTHCLDMKSKALNYITWFGHVG